MPFERWLTKVKREGCACGRSHDVLLPTIIAEDEVFPAFFRWLQAARIKSIYLVADHNTFQAAGQALQKTLIERGFLLERFIFDESPEPDENAVALVRANAPEEFSLLLVVGSGTLNDIGKVFAKEKNVPFVVFASAPSMDGYTSQTASMLWQGRKVSLDAKAPDVVVADYEVLRHAPLISLQSGIGDMVAKAVSIPEWKIASLITGEHYCESIARLVTEAMNEALSVADSIKERDKGAVKRLFDGLILSGLAMNVAGHSRPASGTEHYISHIWDMRQAALGLKNDTHGRQCGVGTLQTMNIFSQILMLKPAMAKAKEKIDAFDREAHEKAIRALLGSAAEPIIALEESERKYARENVLAHARAIVQKWSDISEIYEKALAMKPIVVKALLAVEAPQTIDDLAVEKPEIEEVMRMTKDIRDKYISTRLLFDLGVLDQTLAKITENRT